MTIHDILNCLEKAYPKELALPWDNVGLMCGDLETEVKKIYICLDISTNNIAFAKANGANLMISHHPMIFAPLRTVNYEDHAGRNLTDAIKADIAVISMHTNLDICDGGINDTLAKILKLDEICKAEDNLGRCGKVHTPHTATEYAEFVKKSLNIENLCLFDAHRPVYRLIVCGGSGDDLVSKALSLNADTILCGELKHHEFIKAADVGINVICVSHYASEFCAVHIMSECIAKDFPDIPLVKEEFVPPFVIC